MTNKIKSHQLERILNNKRLGSSELVELLNEYLLSIGKVKSKISRSLHKVKKTLGHFEDVNSYIRQLQSANKAGRLHEFLSSYSIKHKDNLEIIFDKMYGRLKHLNSFITLSRSRTVLEILKLWYEKNKKIKVVVCESRPKLEGRLMAESLALEGIHTELITDAMMGLYVSRVEAAVIGADIILTNGNVINKVGSFSLSLICRAYNKPFYVVTTQSKFSSSDNFKIKKENPKEVLDKKNKNLTVRNIYFEEIDKKYISKVFTE
jgi:translation initiation factor 2B subunit (eIF-2B alpha/beta/delta family)